MGSRIEPVWITPRGKIRSVAGTNPAAGAEIQETVPTGKNWKIHAIRATLVSSATVANRIVDLIIDDGTDDLDRYSSGLVQTASQTIFYNASAQGLGDQQQNQLIRIPISVGQVLGAGFRIRTSTNGIQVGDQWQDIMLWVEEFDDLT